MTPYFVLVSFAWFAAIAYFCDMACRHRLCDFGLFMIFINCVGWYAMQIMLLFGDWK